ncbi:MAG: ABC transporter ATP-binding protein [Anaerolineae bacterium]|nr:MAG: ABC transporter ATP-binding protein [Anaerolineae bacterium]
MLQIRDLHKSFGETRALRGVSFTLVAGEVAAVLGPSGCGKSTLLALIAGLETPDSGAVSWDGSDLDDTPTHLRGFGLMFQDFMLFPHMDVTANVAFGLKMAGMQPETQAARVAETLSLVGLPDFGARDVTTLSGGEQQRVALARALAPKPRLLMLDEPLGALDRALRERLLADLARILRATHQTALYITHDQEEAYVVADTLILMNAGQVAQIGAPQAVYRAPASPWVARFLGLDNILPGTASDGAVDTAVGTFPYSGPERGAVEVLLRPDAARLESPGILLRGRLVERAFRGGQVLLRLDVNGVILKFEIRAATDLPETGAECVLKFDSASGVQVWGGG